MIFQKKKIHNKTITCLLILGIPTLIIEVKCADDDYNVLHRDGSYEFGYNNPDSYHYADANRNNVVRGEFGARNPGTGAVDATVYTAGPRGYRPRGKNVVRKYDLNQSGPRPVGSRDDPYFDPYEDPSYHFGFRTRTYTREETANRVGDVNGKFSYVDDIGERHNVEFIAGKKTGFHVKTPFPDSNPRRLGPLFFNGRGKPIPRGRTSIQRGLDGSYKFVSAGPDQRRTEVSDSTGHVRGSYTYLDDKGVQHSVHYIAGPETGYRVLKQVKGPHLPDVFPFTRPEVLPPEFYDLPKENDKDLFDTAASGHIKPPKPEIKPTDTFNFGSKKPRPKPSYYDDDDSGDFGDLFGGSSTTSKPKHENGSYKPTGDDGSYKPSSTTVSPEDSGYENGPIPTPNFDEKPTKPTKPEPPSRPYDYSNELDDNFGLFGSESGHFRPGSTSKPIGSYRPPYYGSGGSLRPPYADPSFYGTGRSSSSSYGNDDSSVVTVGVSSCNKCQGTLVTNVGDRTFLVPPGVSVRAHVQAIDLVPISPSVPSPSEQLKTDFERKTEQLNANKDSIVNTKNDTITESTTVKSETTTTVLTTTTGKSNSTST